MWKQSIVSSNVQKCLFLCNHQRLWKNFHNICHRLKGNFFPSSARTRLLTSESGKAIVHKTSITLDNYLYSKPPLKLNLIWLRDHCRCPECYNYTTHQRRCSILDTVHNASVKDCILEKNTLKITWGDSHYSSYPLEWLEEFCGNTKITNHPVPWNKLNVKSFNIRSVDVNEFLNTDKGIKELLTSIIHFGVGFVENVAPTVEATEQVIQKISHAQRTFFGDMWEFSDSSDHQDTAFSREGLGAHTDNTYFSEAGGLQVFHCLHHDGVGGETLLVDGFYVANYLKKNHPQSYTRLTTTMIESEYKEDGKHYLAYGPMLKLNSLTGELEQIRFNMYDRAPLRTVSIETVQQFYEDFTHLSTIISDPTSEWWFKLQPGTVLIFNNWRVLHGRAAYTGHRNIAGCYIGYSDWCSKARTLGLL